MSINNNQHLPDANPKVYAATPLRPLASAQDPTTQKIAASPGLLQKFIAMIGSPFKAAFKTLVSWAVHPMAAPRFLTGRIRLTDTQIQVKKGVLEGVPRAESLKLQTPDGVVLDGMIFKGKNDTNGNAPKKALVYCLPNAMQFEQVGQDIVDYLRKEVSEDVSILLFNPRGVGESGGVSSPDKLQLDSYTAIDHLFTHQGCDQVVIAGTSLGGAYGTMGAALFREQNPDRDITVINDRSFGKLSDEIEAFVKLPVLNKVCAWAVKALGLEMDVTEAVDKLDKSKVFVIAEQGDAMVPYSASLHRAVSTMQNIIGYEGHFQLLPQEKTYPKLDVHNLRNWADSYDASLHLEQAKGVKLKKDEDRALWEAEHEQEVQSFSKEVLNPRHQTLTSVLRQAFRLPQKHVE